MWNENPNNHQLTLKYEIVNWLISNTYKIDEVKILKGALAITIRQVSVNVYINKTGLRQE